MILITITITITMTMTMMVHILAVMMVTMMMLQSIQSAQSAVTEEIEAHLSGGAINVSSPSSWADSAISRRLTLPACSQTVLEPPALEQGREILS